MKTSKELAKIAFPEYRGRKYREVIQDHPISLASYWDGGSRDYFAVINLATLQVNMAPTSSMFDRWGKAAQTGIMIPAGFVVVRRSYFCGKDCGLTVFYPAAQALDYDYESLAGHNLYKITGIKPEGYLTVSRVGYRNSAGALVAVEPESAYLTHDHVPCLDKAGIPSTVADMRQALTV